MASRRFLLLIVGLLALAACGQAGPHAALRPRATTATTNVASSPAWGAEGARLRASKAEVRGRKGAMPFGNSGDWAYQSDPIDITATGDYALTWSKLPASFDYPKSPSTFGPEFPPDVTFQHVPGNVGWVTNADGSRSLQVTITVTEISRPYPNLTVWID